MTLLKSALYNRGIAVWLEPLSTCKRYGKFREEMRTAQVSYEETERRYGVVISVYLGRKKIEDSYLKYK